MDLFELLFASFNPLDMASTDYIIEITAFNEILVFIDDGDVMIELD